MKKKNKILMLILALVVCIVTTTTSVLAVDTFDANGKTGVYQLSADESSFVIPFLRVSDERMELDKSINQVGLFCSNSAIEVKAPQEGAQLLYCNDSVRIDADMEYVMIANNGNVIIDANIKNFAFIFCSGTVTISENANISKNLVVCAPKLEINGNVDGYITGSVGDVAVNKAINGGIKLDVDTMSFAEGVTVGKGVEVNTYNSGLVIPETVGTSKIDILEEKEDTKSFKMILTDIVKNMAYDLIIFAILMVIVKKDKIKNAMDKAQANSLVKRGLITYISLLAIISLGVIVLIAIPKVGVAAILFGVVSLIIGSLLKNIIVGTYMVELIDAKYKDAGLKPVKVLSAISTFALLEILEQIPVIGTIISFVVFIIAIAIVVSLFTTSVNKDGDKKAEVITTNEKSEDTEKETIETK